MNKDLYKGLEDITYTDEEIRRHTLRAKMSAIHKGRTLSAETRAKLSAARKGKPKSAEHRANNSAAQKGKTLSAEHRAKIGALHKGKTMSAEARAKISAAKKGKTRSAEARAKISAGRSKPMMTPNGVFPSMTAVAEAAEVTRITIGNWMKKWPDQYYYINKD